MLVRAGARQQVLAARHGDRDGPPHPEGRRGLDRRPRSDPARLLQHRLVLGTVLGQSPHRPAPARPDRPPFRTDAVRHRPVPARLPELPGHRGPSAGRPRLLVLGGVRRHRSRDGARQRRASSGNRTRRYTPADLDRRPRQGRSAANAVARGREVFADNCARCHSTIPEAAGGAFRNRDFRAHEADRHAQPTGWAPTSRSSPPKSAPSAAARCTRIT